MSEKLFYARVEDLSAIEGADRIKKATIMGFDIIVGADRKVGDFGYLYLPDSVLTDKAVELFGEDILGYVGKNRRVKAITLRDTYSLGLFHADPEVRAEDIGKPVPRELGLYTDYKPPQERPNYRMTRAERKEKKAYEQASMGFPQHFDTQQYLANKKLLQTAAHTEGATTEISLKMHGTSHRVGRILMRKKYPWWSIPWHWFLETAGLESTHEYQIVSGSRRVVFDGTDGYHTQDFRDRVTARLTPLVQKDEVWYVEVVGWENNGTKIMPGNYTYGIEQGRFHVYVYRITKNGIDFDGESVKTQVRNRIHEFNVPGVFSVPTLAVYNSGLPDGEPERWLEHVESPEFAESNGGHIQEGVCIRVDNINEKTPRIFKFKSKAFLVEECGHDID